ncbi:hypothetical protein [Verrucosispora sp. NA02020]|uniref:hypothetical protein n=1 Tax=Verrucosispora sp. NA02020 TaxID=2742132 RepID=UPI0015920321|nr:hypothetical protein [Verrucosispora sp. NA02020]QKW15422.1 hypothetical protein HUT12_23420 [Verrucosispora sp. NA02020]
MRAFTNNNGPGRRPDGADPGHDDAQSGSLAAQLLAAVETFGVDDTREALRDLREKRTEVDR